MFFREHILTRPKLKWTEQRKGHRCISEGVFGQSLQMRASLKSNETQDDPVGTERSMLTQDDVCVLLAKYFGVTADGAFVALAEDADGTETLISVPWLEFGATDAAGTAVNETSRLKLGFRVESLSAVIEPPIATFETSALH